MRNAEKNAERNAEMLEALRALATEKGISEEIMFEALANALVTAYKRMPEAAEEAEVVIYPDTGEIRPVSAPIIPGDRNGDGGFYGFAAALTWVYLEVIDIGGDIAGLPGADIDIGFVVSFIIGNIVDAFILASETTPP